MQKFKVLLAGESWFFTNMEVKGLDHFTTSGYQTEIDRLRCLMAEYADITHIPSHLVPTDFPSDADQLNQYDVVIISDVGSNSFLLHPDTLTKCETTPDKLEAIALYVRQGGAFGMMGGYMTFQGIEGKARWHDTVIEELLPVNILPYDDRVECPAGAVVRLDKNDSLHPIVADFPSEFPPLLGYNRLTAKPDTEVLLSIGKDPLLAIGHYENGRTFAWASDCAPHWMPPAFCDWEYNSLLWKRIFSWCTSRS